MGVSMVSNTSWLKDHRAAPNLVEKATIDALG